MKIQFLIPAIISCFLFPTAQVIAQENWFAQFGGEQYQRVSMTAHDANGNIYVCGSFRGSFDANPGAAEFLLNAGTYEDIYVIKLNPEGQFLWAFDIGGSDQDFADQIRIDTQGNIYLTGTFQGEVDFDPGSGEFLLETLGSPLLSSNMFVAKYSPDGSFLQALHFRTTVANNTSRNTSLAIDANGNLFISGTVEGPVDMHPLDEDTILIPDSDFGDIVLAKLTAEGELIWTFLLKGALGEIVEDITLDNQGNVYYTGIFRSEMDFNPGDDTLTLAPQGNNNFNDAFILSLDSDGNFRWVKGIGWDGSQGGKHIQLGNDGFLYASGVFANIVDFNPGGVMPISLSATGGDDCYLMKLNTEGEVLWAKSWGGATTDFISGLSFGPDDEIIATGSFNSNFTIEATPGDLAFNTEGGYDGCVLTWSGNGELLKGFSFGGDGDDYGRMSYLFESGQYLVAGDFDDNIEFLPGNEEASLTPQDDDDAFIARYNPFDIASSIKAESKALLIYPNPSAGASRLKVNIGTQPAEIQIFDTSGRLVSSQMLNSGSFDISGIAPGAYTLVLHSGNKQTHAKLMLN